MVDTIHNNGATGTHSTNSSDAPNHLGTTNIESGGFDNNEKVGHQDTGAVPGKKVEDEEEDADMDALIEELESEDGHVEEAEDEKEAVAGGERFIPEDQLQTDTRVGLTESEVTARRKKYGMNQMKEEKENLILKFLGFFIGPIQFVMEVSSPFSPAPARRISMNLKGLWVANLGFQATTARQISFRRLLG